MKYDIIINKLSIINLNYEYFFFFINKYIKAEFHLRRDNYLENWILKAIQLLGQKSGPENYSQPDQ